MSYVPTHCDSCFYASLVSAVDIQQGRRECPRCGATLRVIPSCAYGPSDVELFRELGEVVAEAGLTAATARALGQDVARALWAESYATVFESLAIRMPGILPIQLSMATAPSAQRRVFRMLQTIFDSRTSAHRSGTIAAVPAPPLQRRA